MTVETSRSNAVMRQCWPSAVRLPERLKAVIGQRGVPKQPWFIRGEAKQGLPLLRRQDGLVGHKSEENGIKDAWQVFDSEI